MKTEEFIASVQYNDLKGTVAADRSDDDYLAGQLERQGLIGDNEHLIGIEMYTFDSNVDDEKPLWVTVLIQNIDDDSIRELRVDMTEKEFFKCFKRFNIKISSDGDLTGKTLNIIEQ